MSTEEVIARLKLIAEDADGASGCSHEDALIGGLEDVRDDIYKLIEELDR